MARSKDAEAELNLPPGFRFHPTDEELVVHYLCRRAAHRRLPVPIIADVDLYKHDPWHLPERALFGSREWYFFTPRERKYPKGSRPNRAAGSGYWKATGADRPVVAAAAGSARPLGIRKALVFYAGKAPHGLKTDWIMHEYRLAGADRAVDQKGGAAGCSSLRLDDWVLCRLYNKKNNWPGKAAPPPHQAPVTRGAGEDAPSFFEPRDGAPSAGFRTPDRWSSDVHAHRHFGLFPPELLAAADSRPPVAGGGVAGGIKVEDNCLRDLNLAGMASSSAASLAGVASTSLSYQDYLAAIAAPAKPGAGHGSPPPF